MPAECEAKVLDIDTIAVTELILANGGARLGEALLRRYVYDITPGDQGRWIRLRDSGGKATLTVKEVSHDGIDGTYEVEVGVADFMATNELLGRLGFIAKSYQENKRTSFTLEGTRLEIDEWPMIPPYLEIEADTPDEVIKTAARLGYAEHQLTSENTVNVYQRYGIDLMAYQHLSFNTD
jgi:adenylate cyclase class 2